MTRVTPADFHEPDGCVRYRGSSPGYQSVSEEATEAHLRGMTPEQLALSERRIREERKLMYERHLRESAAMGRRIVRVVRERTRRLDEASNEPRMGS